MRNRRMEAGGVKDLLDLECERYVKNKTEALRFIEKAIDRLNCTSDRS